MAETFGATSTTEDVLSGINLRGKRILVTGVSAGIGVETARSLAARGANVIGTARDLIKGQAVTTQIRKDAAANGGSFELVELDLASLASVRKCADQLIRKGNPLDVIIANAGVMATPFSYTTDKFEMQFGTNHLGHFVLVNRITPLIAKGGRLINLSSSGHRFSNVNQNGRSSLEEKRRNGWRSFFALREKPPKRLQREQYDSAHADDARHRNSPSIHPAILVEKNRRGLPS